MPRLAPFLIGSTLMLVGCDVPRAEPRVEVKGARITLPAVKGRPGAGYFTLTAAGLPERLANISSARVQRIELHESMAGGMGPLKDGSFPGKGRLSFEPGGKHAMLFGIDPALQVGDRVPLTFTFERAPAVTVEAEVQGPGGSPSTWTTNAPTGWRRRSSPGRDERVPLCIHKSRSSRAKSRGAGTAPLQHALHRVRGCALRLRSGRTRSEAAQQFSCLLPHEKAAPAGMSRRSRRSPEGAWETVRQNLMPTPSSA